MTEGETTCHSRLCQLCSTDRRGGPLDLHRRCTGRDWYSCRRHLGSSPLHRDHHHDRRRGCHRGCHHDHRHDHGHPSWSRDSPSSFSLCSSKLEYSSMSSVSRCNCRASATACIKTLEHKYRRTHPSLSCAPRWCRKLRQLCPGA